MSARKIESAAMRFPAQRARIKTTKKEHFTSCGEATTFQGTYSGVCYRSLGELPLIDAAAKAKILAVCPGAPAAPAVTAVPDPWKDNHGEDVPLFWQEAKPISFYLALIDDMQVKAVFDMTAGSGALMEAALTRGIQYHGICFNRDHMTWLQAIADRAACGLITVSASALYSDELAKTVKDHFPDLLRTLVPSKDKAEEEEPLEPDSGDDAS